MCCMRVPGRYILIGQTPVPEDDLLTWGRWLEENDRVVFQEQVGATMVSTVFLGLDHNFSDDGPPLLFETMLFTDSESEDYQRRCSTWLEAEAQHHEAVKFVTDRARSRR